MQIDKQIIERQENVISDYQKLVKKYQEDQKYLAEKVEDANAWYRSPLLMIGLGVVIGLQVSK